MIKLNIHDEFEHGGFKFIVTNMQLSENGEGKSIIIRALDPELASKEQVKSIEKEDILNNMMELVKKLSKGGEIGGMSMGIGG
jgi:hypothetical protein